MTKTCNITIKDEVNAKLDGLDLAERKSLVKKFEFFVPGARYLASVRLGRWNGKTSFFSLGGQSYINLLPEIIPVLDAAGYTIDLIDERKYVTSFEFEVVNDKSFIDRVWPSGHPIAGQPIVLRDYQLDVVNKFLMNPQCLQCVPTASGKTIVTAVLSKSIEKYGRSLVIVPNVSLVTQTQADYINMGLDVGVFHGGKKDFGHTHTISTWQSLNALLKQTKEETATITIDEFLKDIVCVIGDECHGVAAAVLKGMLTGILSKIPIRWGLTGTIPKDPMDKMSLQVCFGDVINTLAASDLQEQGVLSNCHVNIIQLQDDVDYKDYQTELKFLLSDDKRMSEMAKIITKVNKSGNTLVLVDRIEAGDILLEKLGDQAVFVSGSTKNTERMEQYAEVAIASNKIIIATYQLAAVGINLPRLFNVVLIEPGKSFIRTIQSIGRGLRRAVDKDFVQITDLTSNCKFSKRHLSARKTWYTEANYPWTVGKLKYK